MSLNTVNANTPGGQGFVKLNENTKINNGKADRGIFNKVVLKDIFTSTNYEQELKLGHTLSSYTNWSHVVAEAGYSVWKYPLTSYVDNTNNELYSSDIKLTYAGVASSESTALGFARVFNSNSKRSGATYTNNTTEAGTSSGVPFNLASFTTITNETVSAVHGGTAINLDYENVVNGSVSVSLNTFSSVYTENTDYTISYGSGTIITLSAGSIASGAQLYVSYKAGNTIYVGASATFSSINLDLAVKGVGNVIKFAYSSGSGNWTDYTPTLDSTNNFSTDGNITQAASGLTNWATDTVNNSGGLYWIRIRVNTPGIILPSAYQLVRSDSAATKLVQVSQKDIESQNYKWSYFSGFAYVGIPNEGTSANEGVSYIKSSSNSTVKSNFFVSNQTYLTNYYTGSGTSIIVSTHTPTSAADTGTTGTLTWDAGYIYTCISTDTWKRVEISTWP